MTSLVRPPETHQDRVAKLKTAVLMVHGKVTVDELPESLFDVAAETLQMDNADGDYAAGYMEGVQNLLVNIAGAVVDQDLMIGDDNV